MFGLFSVGTLLFHVMSALAQDMEPRAYSAVPVGINFLAINFAHTWGSLAFSPTLPITGVTASIDTESIGYERSFDLFGLTGTGAVVLPYVEGTVNGQVLGAGQTATRSGLADMGMHFSLNFIGNPASNPDEFASRQPTTVVGASLSIVSPTGQYDPNRLINIGQNQWAFKPEIGISQPVGNWFIDGSAGAWFYTENQDFLNGHVQAQSPIETFQAHVGYNFGRDAWLSLDGNYYSGGQTSTNRVPSANREAVARAGLTLSVPLFADGLSAKFGGSTWFVGHNGGTFNTVSVTLQYRWF